MESRGLVETKGTEMITPYYEKGGITIYCGDCLEVMLQQDIRPDVVITDPPYGINHPTDYKTRKRSALAECKDYPLVIGDSKPYDPSPWLKHNVILWGANYYSHLLPPSSGWLIWDKERPDTLDQSTCELAYTNFVKGVRRYKYLWNGMIRAGDDKLYHPTQKPVSLMEWCLSLKWTPLGKILDPYMGSGTTLVAAQNEGRRAVGIELSEEYCKIAVERLRQPSFFSIPDEPKEEYKQTKF